MPKILQHPHSRGRAMMVAAVFGVVGCVSAPQLWKQWRIFQFRSAVKNAKAEMYHVRERDGVIDPDPENLNTPVAARRRPVDIRVSIAPPDAKRRTRPYLDAKIRYFLAKRALDAVDD